MNGLKSGPGLSRGIVLIVVLGVLALLSVLAITFVSMTRLERAISQNYVDRVRAQLVAESGVEFALQRLYKLSGGCLTADEFAQLQYQGMYPGQPDFVPSFVSPTLADPQGQPLSGAVAGTYLPNGDFFRLKVSDNSGKLNVNGIDSEINSGPGGVFGRMFNLLAELVEELYGEEVALGIGGDVADEILEARSKLPGSKFSTMAQIREVLLATSDLDNEQIKRLFEYLTVHSWTDKKTLKPTFELKITDWEDNPVADDDERIYKHRFMQTRNYDLEPRAPVNVNTAKVALIKALIKPLQGWYLAEGPPNTYTDKHYGGWNAGSVGYDGEDENTNIIGTATRTTLFDSGYEEDQAGMIAAAIYDRIHGVDTDGDGFPAPGSDPDPFETWDEFRVFIEDDMDPEIFIPSHEFNQDFTGMTLGAKKWWLAYHAQAHKDLLLANFNPNAQLNDFNPNKKTRKMVDKGHMISWTTEFCFEPTGYFDIESYGYITGSDNSIAANYSVNTTVKCFEMLRFTSQADFLGSINNIEIDLNSYIAESESEIPTAGAHGLSYNGATLQTYPEPLVEGREDIIRNSIYDGSIAAATYQLNNNDADLYVSFNHKLKPDIYGLSDHEDATDDMSEGSVVGGDSYWPNHPNEDALTSGHDDTRLPGSLYPDGAFSEVNRILSYRVANLTSYKGQTGTVYFWLKPNFHPGISGRIHRLFGVISLKGQVYTQGPSPMGIWYFPHAHILDEHMKFNATDVAYPANCNPGGGGIGAPEFLLTRSLVASWVYWYKKADDTVDYSQSGRVSYTVNHDFPDHDITYGHNLVPEVNFEGRQWNHFAWSWNWIGTGLEGKSVFLINGELISHQQGDDVSGDSIDYDLKYHEIFGARGGKQTINYFRFGELDYAVCHRYMCDSTIDEFSVYPAFGNSTDMRLDWQSGRYLSDTGVSGGSTVGTYTSARIPFKQLYDKTHGDPRRLILRSCSWTFYHPRYNRGGLEGFDIEDNIHYPALNVNDMDDPLATQWGDSGDPIAVDIINPQSGDWHYQANKDRMFTYAGGSQAPGFDILDEPMIYYCKGEEFRFKVYFNLEPGQLLYDTPVLDDITFTFHRSKPKVLYWITTMS
ncbi:PilX N-terminal domain-containing pilus assembly protein [Planctomycetota bacterium]